jgi:mannan endo-1,4-beta-mannosidase
MKILNNFLISLFLFISTSCKSGTQENPDDLAKLPEIIRTKTGIIDYFNAIISAQRIIVGQHCGDNGLTTISGIYNAYFAGLYKSTGKTPALLGTEYGYIANVNYSEINQLNINHWKAGGLVTVTWHADCPWVDGYSVRWNSIINKATIDLTRLVKSATESAERTSYRNELLAVGYALKQLKDAGVIVLWRPFHEMNGNWFWWGINDVSNPTNKKAYEQLWRDMYVTYTQELGLDNLIWVYGSNASSRWTAGVDAMYPGNDVVDVVGVDIYSKEPSFIDFDKLKMLNKPVVISEIGPVEEGYGSFDELQVLKTFKGKAAYFLQWHSWSGAKVAIIDNLNVNEMMQSPDAITLDELKK